FYQTTAQPVAVTLSDDTAGAEIRHTTDGSAPTPCGTAAGGATSLTTSFNVNGAAVATALRVIACKPGGGAANTYQPSDEHAATVGDAGAQVTFVVNANGAVQEAAATGANPFPVTLDTINPANAVACFTLDGSNPDCDAAGTMCTAGTPYNGGAP